MKGRGKWVEQKQCVGIVSVCGLKGNELAKLYDPMFCYVSFLFPIRASGIVTRQECYKRK